MLLSTTSSKYLAVMMMTISSAVQRDAMRVDMFCSFICECSKCSQYLMSIEFLMLPVQDSCELPSELD